MAGGGGPALKRGGAPRLNVCAENTAEKLVLIPMMWLFVSKLFSNAQILTPVVDTCIFVTDKVSSYYYSFVCAGQWTAAI